jgi:hypothetical protein
MESIDKRKYRDKIVVRGRSEIRRRLKVGDYMDEKRKEYGIMNESEFVLDKEFLNSMITDIESSRMKRMIYDKDYQNIDLNRWYEMRKKLDKKKLKSGE